MLFIIIAVILAVAWIIFAAIRGWSSEGLGFVAALIAALIVGAGLLVEGLIDFGYEEKELIREVELVSLNTSVTSEGSGHSHYVSVSATNVYSYRYEKENTTGIEGKLYETDTVSGNVQELESAECNKPVLLVYKREAKGKFWLSLFAEDEISYVFYVPEGTIVKDITLN